MTEQQKSLSYEVRDKGLLVIETGVVAVAVYVCGDSNYNLYAMCCKR